MLTVMACLQAYSVSAQQLLRAPAGSDTDLVTSDRLTRTFKINPNAFLFDPDDALATGLMVESKDIQDLVRDYFKAAGIALSGTAAPRLFFNERTGTLMAQGTIAQLEAVETAVKALTDKPVHVMVEVRLMETASNYGNARLKMLLAQLQANDFVLPSALPLQNAEESGPALRTATLTESEFARLLKSAEQSEGIDILSMPRTVTSNGRQARIVVEQPYETISDPPMRGGIRLKLNAE